MSPFGMAPPPRTAGSGIKALRPSSAPSSRRDELRPASREKRFAQRRPPQRANANDHSPERRVRPLGDEVLQLKLRLNDMERRVVQAQADKARVEQDAAHKAKQIDALLRARRPRGDGDDESDGATAHHGDTTAVASVRRQHERSLIVRRLREQLDGVRADLADRDATVAALRSSQRGTALLEVEAAKEEYFAEVLRLRRLLAQHTTNESVDQALRRSESDDVLDERLRDLHRRLRAMAHDNAALRAALDRHRRARASRSKGPAPALPATPPKPHAPPQRGRPLAPGTSGYGGAQPRASRAASKKKAGLRSAPRPGDDADADALASVGTLYGAARDAVIDAAVADGTPGMSPYKASRPKASRPRPADDGPSSPTPPRADVAAPDAASPDADAASPHSDASPHAAPALDHDDAAEDDSAHTDDSFMRRGEAPARGAAPVRRGAPADDGPPAAPPLREAPPREAPPLREAQLREALPREAQPWEPPAGPLGTATAAATAQPANATRHSPSSVDPHLNRPDAADVGASPRSPDVHFDRPGAVDVRSPVDVDDDGDGDVDGDVDGARADTAEQSDDSSACHERRRLQDVTLGPSGRALSVAAGSDGLATGSERLPRRAPSTPPLDTPRTPARAAAADEKLFVYSTDSVKNPHDDSQMNMHVSPAASADFDATPIASPRRAEPAEVAPQRAPEAFADDDDGAAADDEVPPAHVDAPPQDAETPPPDEAQDAAHLLAMTDTRVDDDGTPPPDEATGGMLPRDEAETPPPDEAQDAAHILAMGDVPVDDDGTLPPDEAKAETPPQDEGETPPPDEKAETPPPDEAQDAAHLLATADVRVDDDGYLDDILGDDEGPAVAPRVDAPGSPAAPAAPEGESAPAVAPAVGGEPAPVVGAPAPSPSAAAADDASADDTAYESDDFDDDVAADDV
ncbi:hypothetical protein M885DRAFT_623302 [Pelagophyceae sp. CCMP2097]|nr:hypothetical protein M885DRAFT_623302 [Pelagophyceae sp. CCMP2097]